MRMRPPYQTPLHRMRWNLHIGERLPRHLERRILRCSFHLGTECDGLMWWWDRSDTRIKYWRWNCATNTVYWKSIREQANEERIDVMCHIRMGQTSSKLDVMNGIGLAWIGSFTRVIGICEMSTFEEALSIESALKLILEIKIKKLLQF